MRKNIVAGNWKMHKSLDEGILLATEIHEKLAALGPVHTKVILGVPFIHLAAVTKVIDSNTIQLSAQNCSSWDEGAYTGEVSARMIHSTGAQYVIIGHSERRKYFNEDSNTLRLKVNLALQYQLHPIFCFGELLEERNKNSHFDVVRKQINEGVFHLTSDQFRNVVLAYEPVWAIGTGVNASAGQAQEMHRFIRQLVSDKYGTQLANDTTILYGGSCKPSNARELFDNPDVDGGLIGGASLNADDFLAIIRSI